MIKFLGLRSSEIGMRTLRIRVVGYVTNSCSTMALVFEYHDCFLGGWVGGGLALLGREQIMLDCQRL